MFKRNRKDCRGSYLLEFAVTVPVLVGFALGSYDLSRYLQVKQAVRAAADTTVRCMYPTDGDCVVANTGPSPLKLFDWFKSDSENKYYLDTFQYGSSVTRYAVDELLFNPTAKVLESMTYQTARNFTMQVDQQWEGRLPYFRRVRGFPTVSGSDPRNPTISPSSPNQTVSLNSNQATISFGSSATINSNTFTITRPVGLAEAYDDCFPPTGPSGNSEPTSSDSRCHETWPGAFSDVGNAKEMKQFTYVLLYVTASAATGVTQPGDPLTEGVAGIRLRNLNTGNIVDDLGGQQFNTGTDSFQSRNFWVRGAPGNGTAQFPAYSPDGNGAFHPAIKIKYNTPYRLEFPISYYPGSGPNDIKFRVNGINLWFPDYVKKFNRWPDCPGFFAPGSSSADVSLVCVNIPAFTEFRELYQASDLGNICAENISDAISQAVTNAPTLINTSIQSTNISNVTAGADCSGATYTHYCPAPGSASNFGFDSYSAQQKLDICLGTNHPDYGNTHDEQFQSLTKNFGPIYVSDCSGNPPPQSSYPAFAQYLDFIWGPSTPTGNQFEELVTNLSSCAINETVSIPNTLPLFAGHVPHIGCDWEEDLKDTSLLAWVNNSFSTILNPFPYPIKDIDLTASASVDGAVEISEEQFGNLDDCQKWHAEKITDNVSTTQIGNDLPEGTVPSECQGEDHIYCHTQFAGYQGGTPPADPHSNQTAAQTAGLQAFQAAVPHSVSGCTGPHCLNLTTNETSTAVTSTVTYELPLLLLGNSTITVSANSVERLERTFAKE